jgi:hypothetical protein
LNTSFENLFKLRRPCANCPFLKEGAIDLAPGRLAGIIRNLVVDDHSTFYCHKTVHGGRARGQHLESGEYVASGDESMCAGAMIYLEKIGRPTVGMRLGSIVGIYSRDCLKAHFARIIDPPTSKGS